MTDLHDETFGGTFPFAPHDAHINGFAMHYVDEGSGEPLVMLHGDPTWGYLYRNFIPPLAGRYRCIVPDQMGMGKSGTPQDRSRYHLRQHSDNLEALLDHLGLTDLTLVLHDWGGPVGLGFATRHPERVKRLVLLNTWAFAPWPDGAENRLTALIRSPRGEAFVLRRNGYVEPAILGATHHPEHLTETVMAAYRAPFPTPESRLALLCWSRDIPLGETDASYAEMRQIEEGLALFREKPVLVIWGMQDPVFPLAFLDRWRQIYPDATVHEIADASHFLQEDAPARIVAQIAAFLAAHP